MNKQIKQNKTKLTYNSECAKRTFKLKKIMIFKKNLNVSLYSPFGDFWKITDISAFSSMVFSTSENRQLRNVYIYIYTHIFLQ